MLKSNRVPITVGRLISLGIKARAGAQSVGAAVGLAQNTPARIAADVHDLTGNPDTPLVPGKQSRHAAQKAVVKEAHAAVATTRQAGIEFCRLAIGVLKGVLGSRWNSQWNTAGFVSPTLALPADPVAMLVQFREFYKMNPIHEVAALQLTAVRAQGLLNELQQARSALAQARAEQIIRMRERDAALTKLRARLCGLRSELDQILDDADGRWYEFGFRRPADGRTPEVVEDVEVTVGAPGVVLVNWKPAARAENYRVMWRRSDSAEDWTEAGIFMGTQCVLKGVPSDVPLDVGVSARSASGETRLALTARGIANC